MSTGTLEDLLAMTTTKRSAFLGLFAGANRSWRSFNGEAPNIGKAECEWVDDWRDFYSRELVDLGWLTFTESEPRPALGMAPGSTVTSIDIEITADGRNIREAYWSRP